MFSCTCFLSSKYQSKPPPFWPSNTLWATVYGLNKIRVFPGAVNDSPRGRSSQPVNVIRSAIDSRAHHFDDKIAEQGTTHVQDTNADIQSRV